MAELSVKFTEMFWQSALGLVPLAIAVGLFVRFLPCRPATRHTLWLTLTVWLLVSPWLPTPPELPELDWQAADEIGQTDKEATSGDLESDSAQAQLTYIPAPKTRPDSTEQPAKHYTPKADSAWAVDDWSTVNRTPPSHEELAEPRAWQNDNRTSFPRFVARPVQDPMDMLARGTDAGGPHSDFALQDKAEPTDLICSAEGQLNLPLEHTAQFPHHAPIVVTEDLSIQTQLPVISPVKAQSDAIPPARELVHSITSIVAALFERIQAFSSVVPAWVSTAATIRDAVLALPPLPIIVWASGIMLVVVVKLISLVCFLRRVQASGNAPRSVLDLVRETSKQLGLKNPPKTLMTEAKISPMVWCGRRPLLILPRTLWQQLDRESKRAVICHELAHIRRKDHWVAWLETVVGAVYWWHPVVWWVRSRLHVEAENCCDAWVTWLFPTERRAYAGALLATKKYIGMNESRAPVAGMQMTSGRAGRFARRLTMVMTKSIVPRLSVPGLALAAVLAFSSWLTAPAWSCPKEAVSAEPVKAVELVSDEQSRSIVVVATPESDEAVAASESSQSTYAYFMASKDQNEAGLDQALRLYTKAGQQYAIVAGDRNRDKLERRLEKLERQLAKLGAHLGKINSTAPSLLPLADKCGNCAKCAKSGSCSNCSQGASCANCAKFFGKNGASATVGSSETCGSCAKAKSRSKSIFGRARSPRASRSIRAPRSPRVRRAPKEPGFIELVLPDNVPPAVPQVVAPRDLLRSIGSFKPYELSAGKLDALITLMSRSDVPIIIRPGDGYIEVQGGPDVQNLFRSFVNLIEPGEETVVEYKLSKGKLKALINLMSRSDIPVLIEPTSRGINVHGNALQQYAFSAFVDAISGSNARVSLFSPGTFPELIKREKAEKRAARHRQKNEAHVLHAHEKELRRAEKQGRKAEDQARRSMKRQLRQTEKQFRKIKRQRHLQGRLRDRALRRSLTEEKLHQSKRSSLDLDSLLEQLAALTDEIPSQEILSSVLLSLDSIESKSVNLHEKREMIEQQARQLEGQARVMAERAIEFADKAQGLESKSDELDLQADELGDLTEELHQALEEAKDDDTRAKVLAEHAALITQADKLQDNIDDLESQSDELAENSEDFEDQSQAYAVLAEFLLDTVQTMFDRQASK